MVNADNVSLEVDFNTVFNTFKDNASVTLPFELSPTLITLLSMYENLSTPVIKVNPCNFLGARVVRPFNKASWMVSSLF